MARPFTIGIDLRVLTSGRQSGVEQYVLNLLPALFKLAPEVKFKLFLNSFQELRLDYPWMRWPQVELYRFYYPNRLLLAAHCLLAWPKMDRLLQGVDVFFSPHLLLAPVRTTCQLVTTFHDLSFLHAPQFFSWQKNLWHRLMMKPWEQARRADRLIAVSYSTRNDLISFFGVSSQKIKVIYSGLNLAEGFNHDFTEVARVRTKYQLPDNFFLYLGTIEPRKNILGILRAFDYLHTRNQLPSESHLVVAGERGWCDQDLFKFYEQSPCKKLIHFTGAVDEKDKVLIYQLARVFVYPSFFEGFGFPPLEAMQMGLPVVVSRTSSLPEVVGEAAVLIDPYNVQDLAEAMAMLFLNEKMREEYRCRGQQRVRQFSWEKSAEATLEVLLGARG